MENNWLRWTHNEHCRLTGITLLTSLLTTPLPSYLGVGERLARQLHKSVLPYGVPLGAPVVEGQLDGPTGKLTLAVTPLLEPTLLSMDATLGVRETVEGPVDLRVDSSWLVLTELLAAAPEVLLQPSTALGAPLQFGHQHVLPWLAVGGGHLPHWTSLTLQLVIIILQSVGPTEFQVAVVTPGPVREWVTSLTTAQEWCQAVLTACPSPCWQGLFLEQLVQKNLLAALPLPARSMFSQALRTVLTVTGDFFTAVAAPCSMHHPRDSLVDCIESLANYQHLFAMVMTTPTMLSTADWLTVAQTVKEGTPTLLPGQWGLRLYSQASGVSHS